MDRNRDVVRYDILKGGGVVELTECVQAAIEEGWQPIGSPFINDALLVCQAMVQYDEPVYTGPG